MFWKRGVLLIISAIGCGSVQGSAARPDAGDPGAPDGATGADGSGGADGATGADGPDTSTPVPRIKASNTVTRSDLATGIAPLVVPAGKTYVIDTDQGSVVDATASNAVIRAAGAGLNGGIYYRTDNQNRAFFAVDRLTVEDTAILRGVGGRALVLIAEGPIELHGIIDVSAGHCAASDAVFCAGPGGGRGGDVNTAAAGCSPGQAGTGDTGSATGGGGGGFASKGGAGGAPLIITIAGPARVSPAVSPTPSAVGSGGSGAGCPAPALEPIQGGSGGHHGGAFFVTTAGGGGGGAVQVTSYTSITAGIAASGHASGVWAGGGGGSTGHAGLHAPSAGSGGGSGGAILLEAPSVTIGVGVVLAANGGGGGAGQQEAAGQAGVFGSAPALGGGASGSGIGGAGAALATEAGDGAAGLSTATSAPSGGGGGGGVGRIRINTIDLNVAAQAIVSPTASINVPAATE